MTPAAFGVDLLGNVLDGAALRHQVIAQNVANVNTPGYRRRAVTFEQELARQLEQKGVEAPYVSPRVIVQDGPIRFDGNSVDIVVEMNDLTRNALYYQAVTQVLTSRLAMLRAAIAGR
ncbi:MAG: flagellar basal body protein [Gemmataceae bacterium]|nr:flagellar basal body protein [Gemmataceae bacterium]MDW8241990.1 flagellar basal body protein [Thermogemmata sp.]